MWPYENHKEEDYYKAIEYVENYAVSLGAEFVCNYKEKFTTLSGDNEIKEEPEMRVYKYKDEYFWVEHHFLSDCPFIVFSFGKTIEDIFEDAEPFPYNLPKEELEAEVKYSLLIEPYPKNGSAKTKK